VKTVPVCIILLARLFEGDGVLAVLERLLTGVDLVDSLLSRRDFSPFSFPLSESRA